jgi:hypothetical protein
MEAFSSFPVHLQKAQMNLPNSPSINIAKHCPLCLQLSSRYKRRWGRRAVGKKQQAWSLLSRSIAMATGRGQQRGWEKGTMTVRGQGLTQALARLMIVECSCLLCPLNKATDCSFWGSFPKCVMRKRQDVNVLSRKNNVCPHDG